MGEIKRIDDGGPAFAHAIATVDGNGNPLSLGDVERNPIGMSLRDWLAGQALVSPYAHHDASPDKIAEWAYQIADAMIAARKGGA